MSVQAARHVCGTYYETTLNPIVQHPNRLSVCLPLSPESPFLGPDRS